MKILITGAAGGIGSLVTESLSLKNDVILVDNFRNGFQENLPGYKIHDLDICSKEFFDFVIDQKPDVILHLAAITSLPDCETNKAECINVNVNGTVNVLESARYANVGKVIFASTSAVYENNNYKEAPFSETLNIDPLLFYSMSKKMAEDVCRSYTEHYGLKILILRFFNIFGPNQDTKRKSPPLLNYLVQQILSNESPVLHSTGYQKRDYVSAYDLVRLFDLILEDENFSSGCYNVSSGITLSVRDIVSIVESVLSKSSNAIYRSAHMLWDSYPVLFESQYPLDKNVIRKEADKFSLGDCEKISSRYNWHANPDYYFEFEKVILNLAKRLNNEF